MKTAALAGCGSSGPSSSWNAEQADSVWSEHVADAGTPLTADEFETTTCRRRGRIPPVTTNDCVTWLRGALWAARTPDRLCREHWFAHGVGVGAMRNIWAMTSTASTAYANG